MNIKEEIGNIKDEIRNLLLHIKELEVRVLVSYDWDNAPVICELDGNRYILGPESDEMLTWEDAIIWCDCIDAILPPREVLLMCFVKESLHGYFKGDAYWSRTESTNKTNRAWIQKFQNLYYSIGASEDVSKNNFHSVRAVRKVKAHI